VDQAATTACLGEHAQATAEIEAVLKDAELTAHILYDAACAYALAAATVERDAKIALAGRHKLAQGYASRAIELLRKAIARGYRDLGNIEKDKELDAFRSCPDFRQLLAELKKT
jgi:hypothetical protein